MKLMPLLKSATLGLLLASTTVLQASATNNRAPSRATADQEINAAIKREKKALYTASTPDDAALAKGSIVGLQEAESLYYTRGGQQKIQKESSTASAAAAQAKNAGKTLTGIYETGVAAGLGLGEAYEDGSSIQASKTK